MIKIILMCGLPGSGKTFYATKKMERSTNLRYVSRDCIRSNLVNFNTEDYFSHENEVFSEFINDIVFFANQGSDVIADATHLNRKSRIKTIKAIKEKLNIKVKFEAIFMDTPIEKCIENNNIREGWAKVPENTIKSMATRITKPSFDEGFGFIWIKS